MTVEQMRDKLFHFNQNDKIVFPKMSGGKPGEYQEIQDITTVSVNDGAPKAAKKSEKVVVCY